MRADDDAELWVQLEHTPGPTDHHLLDPEALPPVPPRRPLGFAPPGRHRADTRPADLP